MNWQEFEEKFPIELNQQQKKAVQKVDGPGTASCCAGSGKTTVLVTRLGYMALCCGIPPENILTVTYTVARNERYEAQMCRLLRQGTGRAFRVPHY